jgi:hypothetical protein
MQRVPLLFHVRTRTAPANGRNKACEAWGACFMRRDCSSRASRKGCGPTSAATPTGIMAGADGSLQPGAAGGSQSPNVQLHCNTNPTARSMLAGVQGDSEALRRQATVRATAPGQRPFSRP